MNKSDELKEKIYDFVVRYKYNHDGCSPSLTDIANEVGFARGYVRVKVVELRKEGIIKFDWYQHCAIQIPGGYMNAYEKLINTPNAKEAIT